MLVSASSAVLVPSRRRVEVEPVFDDEPAEPVLLEPVLPFALIEPKRLMLVPANKILPLLPALLLILPSTLMTSAMT